MNITVQPLKKYDCKIVGIYSTDKKKASRFTKKKFEGKWKEAVMASGSGKDGAEFVWVVGLGKRQDFGFEKMRKLASMIYKKARAEKWETIHLNADIFPTDDAHYAQALTEGLLLSAYQFTAYKSKKTSKTSKESPRHVSLITASAKRQGGIQKAITAGIIISDGVNLARSFGNEPANKLYPDSYAKQIQKVAKTSRLKCQVLDEKKMAQLKMGGILGVGIGSARPPRLVILEHQPSRAKNSKPIVLVGKGITFDTGGISIKPSKSMEDMKFDMCGSAAVVGAMSVIAKLKLPVHVIGLTPLAENMPGREAQRPGDIVTCFGGKTVEVLNTDAEGRLVLADALAYSEKFKPACVVDIATLTGACAYVLDYAGSGVMGTDTGVVNKLIKAGSKSGERLWEFPLWEEYGEFIKGTYGDIQNISRKAAGIQTAGMFLKHFGNHSPWAHVDIAGTAWGHARDYHPTGATGVGVRLFVEFVKSYL